MLLGTTLKTETAWRRLVIAQAQRGSNCFGRSDVFCPPEDTEGDTALPTPEQAEMLCFRCPLLGRECRVYRESLGGRFVGVLDGQVADYWPDDEGSEE